MAESKQYQLRIMDEEIIISTDASSEYLSKLINYVERRAREIKRSSLLENDYKVALLTLILLANEIHLKDKDLEAIPKQEEDVQKRLVNLIEMIDSSLDN